MPKMKSKFSTLVLLFATLQISLLISAPITNAQVPLFIFGDSLYDTGMSLYSGARSDGARYWPYGETFFGQPSGRFCDGRTIPDFIAEYAGLPYPKPYLLPGLNDFTKGVNFASAGACVLVETRPGTVNLKMQVDYFSQMVQKLKQQVGQAKAMSLLGQAVYLFNIAGNDYASLLNINHKKLPMPNSVTRPYMYQVLGNLTIHIKTIYNQGGRKFAFQNIGPLGCMPSTKDVIGFRGTCASEPQHLAKVHNALFLAVTKKLESQLSGFKYTVYDSYSSAYFRVVYGKKYGFTDTSSACCGSGIYNGEFTCQKKGTGFKVCSDPNNHLYFDAGHYTQRANQEFSQQFWSGGSNLVAPYNLKSLFSMN